MSGPRPLPPRRALSADDHVQGVLAGDRGVLARTITLIESSNPDHQRLAEVVLTRLMPHTGGALRVGITGVPGVGKSTFVEALGCNLTAEGHKIAVLAIDPSSTRSGGSILGDKTRMARLSVDPRAFIRPTPTAGTLGGVASRTREALLICEAAGFDVVLVETVGVGQSELIVADMTDFFLVLMLAGAGDELQGIKRGLMEMADLLAINKADGVAADPGSASSKTTEGVDLVDLSEGVSDGGGASGAANGEALELVDGVTEAQLRARRAASAYRNAIRLLHPRDAPWLPPVMTCSALQNRGLDAIWGAVLDHRRVMIERDLWRPRRQRQHLSWLWSMLDERLRHALQAHPEVQRALPEVERAVLDGTLAPTTAAARLLAAFLGRAQKIF